MKLQHMEYPFGQLGSAVLTCPLLASSTRWRVVKWKKRESLDAVLDADSPYNSYPLEPMSPPLLAGQPMSP